MEKLQISKKINWDWIIVLNNKLITLDCFREKNTIENLVKIERNLNVPKWYLAFEFIGVESDFQLTLKNWVLSITN